MKKLSSVILLIAIAILSTSIVLYAGDNKSVKKEATKCPMSDKKAGCTDKTAKSDCAGMDATKSKDDKCAKACADKKAGNECKHDSQECKDKMAKGECKHDSKECKDKCAADCKHENTPKK